MSNLNKQYATVFGSALLALTVVGAVHAAAGNTPATSTTRAVSSAVSEADATVALNRALAKLGSLEASFSQKTIVANSTSTARPQQGLRPSHMNRSYSGTMQVKRPGQFRWETTSPMQQLIVTNGQTVWIYDPDLEQATRQQMDAQVGNTPALLLSGKPDQIKKAFRVTQPNRSQANFVLYPRSKDGSFESLTIRFQGDVPSQMVLQDSLGQKTDIQFSNVKLNPRLNDQLFVFKPPVGTDVIDQ